MSGRASIDFKSIAEAALPRTNNATDDKGVPHNPPSDQDTKKPKTFWKPVLPAPADAGERPLGRYMPGQPDAVWIYLDANSFVNGYVYRFLTSDGGKETLPLYFAENDKTGNREWRWMAFLNSATLWFRSAGTAPE